ncbi:MAG: MFS transporter [Erythrobacter sp.]|uniref:MFS transporter n=1 Tax=Erythrobacter sp. TaxID=1042 RepID=UPI00329856F3
MTGAEPYQRRKLFWIGVLTLFTAAMLFALRVGLTGEMTADVYAGVSNPGEAIGSALGAAFLGFAITLFAASPLLDAVGIGNVLRGAGICFLAGVLLAVSGSSFATAETAQTLFYSGFLIQGVGWGAMEAAVNPMTTALYPKDKTHRLNVLHAWWPAGIVVGGLIGFGVSTFEIPWRLAMATAIVPALGVLLLSYRVQFPPTERAAVGISLGDMLLEIIRAPTFLIWLGAMLLTVSLELGPGAWINAALSAKVGFNAVLLLVYVAGVMFIMRHFAGPLSRMFTNAGVLWICSLLAIIGLFMMARVQSPAMVILAATIWGLGVSLLWPTMMASVSERYPRGGSWFIGLIGSAGALTINFLLPVLGRHYDAAMAEAAGGQTNLAALRDAGTQETAAQLQLIEAQAAPQAFEFVAQLSFPLLVIFGAIWLFDRMRRAAQEDLIKSKAKRIQP